MAVGAILIIALAAGLVGARLAGSPDPNATDVAAATENLTSPTTIGATEQSTEPARTPVVDDAAFDTVALVAADVEAAASDGVPLDADGLAALAGQIDRLASAIDGVFPEGPGDALRAAGAALMSISDVPTAPPVTGFAPFVLQYPVPGHDITDGFGTIRGDDVHHGIDIGAPLGTPILAAADGVVLEAGLLRDAAGNGVILQHEGGWETRYFHMASPDLPVKPGDEVVAGQEIGTVGSTGLSTGPHLHFEIVFGPLRMDPENGFTYIGR